MSPKSPTPALESLAIAVLLLTFAALGLVILNLISTHTELISTSLGNLDEAANIEVVLENIY